MNVWANVSGTSLTPASYAPLTRVTSSNACGSDGINSICFDQPDMAFTPGVLAFTRVITADQSGIQLGNGAPATQIGQILDADIYFNPSDSLVTFATPAALAANPKAYDLESLLTHELSHTLGFSHSAVWSAMMYPFAPAPGTFTNLHPTAQQLDAPLSLTTTAPASASSTTTSRTHSSLARFKAVSSRQIRSRCPRLLPASPGSSAHTSSPWMPQAAPSLLERWGDGVVRRRGPCSLTAPIRSTNCP